MTSYAISFAWRARRRCQVAYGPLRRQPGRPSRRREQIGGPGHRDLV